MKKLTEAEINEALGQLSNWELVENAIETSLEFESFKDCFTIMTRIAFEVEAQNHHPEWYNVYNRLSIRLTTHDAGGVTQKDVDLATTIEKIIVN